MTNKMTTQIIKPQRLGACDITRDNIGHREQCNVKTHDYCTYVTETVNNKLKNNHEISDILLTRFLSNVCGYIECWSYNYNFNLNILNRLLDKFKDKHNFVAYKIIHSQNIEVFLLYLNFLKSIDNINEEIIKEMFKLINDSLDYGNKKYLHNTLIEYCIDTQDKDIINICFDLVIDNNLIEYIEKILDLKIKPSNKQFIKLIKVITFTKSENNINIIKKCILNGIEINKNTINEFLELLFSTQHYFYDNKNVSSILIFLYENGSNNITIDKITDYLDNSECSNSINSMFDKFINYLIDNKYELTKEEFKKLCEHKIIITKITKDIQQYLEDEEIKTIIFNNGLSYKIKIDYNINILENECKKHNNLKRISEICKSVQPNQKCLENACSQTGNIAVIRLLHNEYKVPFTEKCIIDYAKINYSNGMMNYVINKYVIEYINNNFDTSDTSDNSDNI
jgi:hypothetical protein